MRPILALTALAFVLYLVVPPAFPFMQTDSGSYIRFEPMRTAGYPLFLATIQAVAGNLKAIIPVQLFAMVGSAGYLAIELRRLTGSTLMGVLALIFIATNLFIYRYAFTVMSEALFFSGVAILIALLCRFASAGGVVNIAAISFTVSVCILIRPVAYIFVPILVICAILRYRMDPQWWRPVVWALLPAFTVLMVGSLVYHNHHGTFRTQSFLGHNLIGKIAYLPGDNVDSRYPKLVTLINSYMDPLRAVEIDNLHDRFLFQERHYDFVRYRLTTPDVVKRAEADATSGEEIRTDVALGFIKAHPAEFAGEALLQLYSLWTVADLRTAADNRRFASLVAALPFDPFKDTVTPTRKPMPWPVVYGIRAFMLAILAISLFSLIYTATLVIRGRRVSAEWGALALVALLLHGYFCLIAALQVGYFRYLIVMWPAIITIAALFGHIVLTTFSGMRTARRPAGAMPG